MQAKRPQSIFKSYILPIVGMTVFTVLTCTFIVLCIPQFQSGFIYKYAKGILSTSLIVTILAYIAMLITLFYRIDVVHKTIFTLLVLVAIALVVVYIMQKTGFYEKIDSKEKLQAWIKSLGAWPPIIYIAIQFLQVCLLPIPSVISTGAGVMLFGVWWTILYSFIGIMLGSIVAFYVGRLLGYKVVAWIVGKADLDKWLEKMKGKDKVLLCAMFLLPIFPDDLLCFVAGLTKMSPSLFLIIQIISRAITIISTCLFAGSWSLFFKTWWGVVLLTLLVIGVVIAMIYLWKYGEQIENWFMRKFMKKRNYAVSVEESSPNSPAKITNISAEEKQPTQNNNTADKKVDNPENKIE